MKIISGRVRGRKLKTLRGQKTRPLMSRVRQSLFDILAETVCSGPFLDLYAGSGAVGLEAISRGAPEALFVEKERDCAQIIKENILRCRFQREAQVLQADVLATLASLVEAQSYAVAFVGPPYFCGLQTKTLAILNRARHRPPLNVVQYASQEEIETNWSNIQCVRTCTYGDTSLSFFTNRAENG